LLPEGATRAPITGKEVKVGMVLRCLAWYLVFTMLFVTVLPRVDAAFSPSEMIGCLPSQERFRDAGRIQAVLEREMIEVRLQALGFNVSEIENRLRELNDQQVHILAVKLQEQKVGGNGEGVLLGILIIALVIGVILPLLGIKVWR
jgi:hypothetical protein